MIKGESMILQESQINYCRLTTYRLIPLIFTGVVLSWSVTFASGPKVMKNPYAGIDWERVNQYMANFHSHTIKSDGRAEPDHLIYMFADAGYSILAIADHDLTYTVREGERDPGTTTETTWPWTRWIDEQPSMIWAYEGMETSAFYPDLGDAGMLAIRANELSQHPHLVSLFNDCGFARRDQTDDNRWACIESRNGLGYWAHTSSYVPPHRWNDLFDASMDNAAANFGDHIIRFPSNLGIEFTSGCLNSRQDDAIKLFDKILMDHYRDHDIFVHGSDDTHQTYVANDAVHTILLAEELTEEAVRHALQNGHTFVARRTMHPPRINRIEVDEASMQIIVDIEDPYLEPLRPAEGAMADNPPEFEWESNVQINWIKNGQKYATGKTINYSGFPEAVLRFEFSSGGETFYSQAFYIAPEDEIEAVMSTAERQMRLMLEELDASIAITPEGRRGPLVSPRSIREETLHVVASTDWTSGFFPGNLWMMYEYTGDAFWLDQARERTAHIEREKTNGGTHDMGFKIFGSFGHGYRLTGDPEYLDIIIESAQTLITRYSETVGAIRSWDHNTHRWDYPVIIDNMMNLELLFWVAEVTGDSIFYDIAVEHAWTTLEHHFREDNSSYHVIDFNPKTGEVQNRNTHQGASDESAWARGQAWGLYGFTMTYRFTGIPEFLDQAEKIAEFMLYHSNLPEDLVPYWDFNAPEIPNEVRDASAAAIMVSALYELSELVPEREEYYMGRADEVLNSLISNYRTRPGESFGFLLRSGTGHHPHGYEIDTPLIYSDYYFLEAILRRQALKQQAISID